MKKTLALLLTTLLISSCSFKITEKMALMDLQPKYKIKEYRESTQKDSTLTNLQKVARINQADTIAQSKKEEIFADDSLKINRKYFNPNDSITLEYFVFTPIKANKTIYYFIGNLESIFDILDNLKTLSKATNAKIFLLHYRGYGNSNGAISFKTQFNDNTNFYQYTQPEIVGTKIAIGYSLGSVYATYLGVENKFDEIVLVSPFSNTKDMITNIKRNNLRGSKIFMRPFLSITADDYLMKLSNSQKMTTYTNKLLIMHAIDDNTLAYPMGKHLFKMSKSKDKELITLETGGHGAAFQSKNWNTLIGKLK